MSKPDPAIRLDAVTLAHGSRILFERATLSLPRGSFTALAGANGHGKTTLLRALVGLHPLAAGKLEICGRRPGEVPQTIGYLPQGRRLPAPWITGRDLMAASWKGSRMGLPGLGHGLNAALDRALGLTDAHALGDQPLNRLSGGERQRIFLAQALLEMPSVLLLDEPLSGMDTERQTETIAMLSGLCHGRDMAILMSCHGLDPLRGYIDYSLRIADRHLELCNAAL